MKSRGYLKAYSVYAEQIEETLRSFKEAGNEPRRVWEELVFCLCTPQTRARSALAAVEEMKTSGLIERPEVNSLAEVLRKMGVRFHNKKAAYIFEAHREFPKILGRIRETRDVHVLRDFLVKEVRGLGMKEASHFLRNIGFENLAIIDRHILRKFFKINDSLPLTVKRYMVLEKRFIEYALHLGLSPAAFDLLLWAMSTGEVLK